MGGMPFDMFDEKSVAVAAAAGLSLQMADEKDDNGISHLLKKRYYC